LEISLTSQQQISSHADSVVALQGVKAIGGMWLPDCDSRWNAAVAEHRLHELELNLGMAEHELAVLGISSRR
jgi:hypothetical protein